MNISDKLEGLAEVFSNEFLLNPYLAYTEHGLHALFFNFLLTKLGQEKITLFSEWKEQRVCLIQKEYPTAANFERSRRQNWDISILECPLKSLKENEPNSFDFFSLEAVFEFGLNASFKHLESDIERLAHKDANLKNAYIMHFYRLSEAGARFSSRDCSTNSKSILFPDQIEQQIKGKKVTVFYALVDLTQKHTSIFKKISGQ